MNVLIFVRRRMSKDRIVVSKTILGNENEYFVVSDERDFFDRKVHIHWYGTFFYNASADNVNIDVSWDDIILRCRYLREIEKNKAKFLICRSIEAWRNLLEHFRISTVISLPIDCYTLHCLHIVCRERSIKFVGLVGTFFSNRIRVSDFGELKVPNLRVEVDSKAIDEFIQKVKNTNFRPSWLIGTDRSITKTILIRFVVDFFKPLFFSIYRIISQDPLSFSFPPRRLSKKRMFSTLDRMRASLYMEKRSISDIMPGYIFIPLQFYPEATSDYWIEDIKMVNHHKMVLSIVNALPENQFIIKEHPAAVGRRDENFLKELFTYSNVRFVSTLAPLNTLIEKASVIIGNASTSTLNAIIIEKPVIFFSKPYFPIPYANYFDNMDLEHIRAKFYKFKSLIYTAKEVRDILMEIWRATCEGSLGNYTPIGEKNRATEVMINDNTRAYINSFI